MKTTTITAATKRLNALTVKSNANRFPVTKSSIAFKFAERIVQGEKSIRPVYTSGSGRFCSNQDHTFALKNILNKIGIDYIFTNDAPKGGLTGNLITITTKIK